MNNIVLSSVNLVAGSNNSRYSYSFPNNFNFTNKEIALSTLSIPYSWNSITSAYNNHKFQIKWIDGTVYTVVLPNGNYSISDINSYLQAVLIAQGWYLIDNSTPTTLYHYYLSFQTDNPLYAVQLTSTVLPSALPTGWTYPAGATWTTSALTPQITILPLATNLFANVIGFTANTTYPSANNLGVNYTHNSDFTPQVNQVTSIVMNCSCVDNQYSIPAQVLATIPLSGNAFGSYINPSIGVPLFCKCIGGMFQNITISFFDQAGNILLMNDSSITVQLSIRDADKGKIL